ncbi:TetR/AcrR family transcriptional regulator [Luteococcus peritonei]|uniref:TetR/AcrR family transcriptional regulator n=1 Tax=Luteococcus peritonei TaxID=88874 RepID=A0ABW4RXL3_9ACTN
MSSTRSDLSTEARIRAAAVEAFGSHGFERTTVRQVARAAGVSPGLVMHHFGSKEGLRQACDDWAMAALAQEKTLLTLNALPDMEDYLRQHPEYRPLLAYLVAALRAGGETATRIYDRLLETSHELVEQGIAAGAIRPMADQQAVVAWMVASSCGVMLLAEPFSRALGGDSLTDPAVVNRYSLATADVFTHGLLTTGFADAIGTACSPQDEA